MPDSIIKANNISALDGGGVGLPDGSISNPSMKFTNSPLTGLYRPSANQLGLVTNGIERLRIDSNGQVSSVIPNGNTLYNGFMCRAWVLYDAINNSIYSNGNVSSVTRNSNGNFTITFLNPMPDVNYSPVINFSPDTSANYYSNSTQLYHNGTGYNIEIPLIGSFRFVTLNHGLIPYNPKYVSVAVFR